MSTSLSERYGTRRPWARPAAIAVAVVVAVSFGGWLAWAAWFHGTPAAESELVTFEIVDTHEATAVVHVLLEDGVEATCRVRALAADHSTVGELTFTPVEGDNRVSIRTEREATSVDPVGCTAPGQPRPR